MDTVFHILLLAYIFLHSVIDAEHFLDYSKHNSNEENQYVLPLTPKPPTDKRVLILIEKLNSNENLDPYSKQSDGPNEILVNQLRVNLLLKMINHYGGKLRQIERDMSASRETSTKTSDDISLGKILRNKKKKKRRKRRKKKKKDKYGGSKGGKTFTKAWKEDWLKQMQMHFDTAREQYNETIKQIRPFNIMALEPWGKICQNPHTNSPPGYCVAKGTCEYEYRLPHADSYCGPHTGFHCCQLAISSFDIIPDFLMSQEYEDPRLYPPVVDESEYDE